MCRVCCHHHQLELRLGNKHHQLVLRPALRVWLLRLLRRRRVFNTKAIVPFVSILSVNINMWGLGVITTQELDRLKPNVVCLTETHIVEGELPRMERDLGK